MKRYGEYRDSGVEWIGEIPYEWETRALKYTVSLKTDKVNFTEQKYIGLENIQSGTGRYIETENQEIDGLSTLFGNGDVLFGKLRPYLAKCIIPTFDGICSSEFLVLRNFDGVNKYLQYFLLSPKIVEAINASTYGVKMPRANWSFIGQMPIPMPSTLIQQSIVDYLDRKTAAIDELIADKQKLVALLQEKRNAIISETVTKGLDKTAKMKDSGIDWIGKIPTHWKVTRIKNLFSLVDDRNADEEAELLSLFTAIGVKPRSEMEERGNRSVTVLNYKKVQKGDLIVNKLLAWMGAIAYSDYQGVTSPDYDIYRKKYNADVIQDYYHHYFRNTNFKGDCFKYGHGIMMMRWRTYSNEFFNILALNPPFEEQQAIAEYVRKESDKIDSLISDITEQIKKLKEYRQAVIGEAVTGKVAV